MSTKEKKSKRTKKIFVSCVVVLTGTVIMAMLPFVCFLRGGEGKKNSRTYKYKAQREQIDG